MASTRPSNTTIATTGKKTAVTAPSGGVSGSGKSSKGAVGPAPHSNRPPAKSSTQALAYIQSRTTALDAGHSGGSSDTEGPMERYLRLNMLLLKKLQNSDWAEAESLCTELDRIVPNHPNVLAFRLLLAEKNNGPASPALQPPAATTGPSQPDQADADDDSDDDLFREGEEGSSEDDDEEDGSGSEDDSNEEEAYDQQRRARNVPLGAGQASITAPSTTTTTTSTGTGGKRPTPITPSQSNVRQTPTTGGGQKSSSSAIGTPDDITDDETDRMFAGTAQEAAEIMKRFGILANPGQVQGQVQGQAPRR